MQSSEIVPTNYDISSPTQREVIRKQIEALDQNQLSEDDLRHGFGVLKVFMCALIQKVNSLEHCVQEIQRTQERTTLQMEALYLSSKMEIKSLKAEIKREKLTTKRFAEINKVAQTLKGNPYAPYAIRGLMEGKTLSDEDSVPSDFDQRVEFARINGFRWNQNDRAPAKKAKQLLLLEKWEKEFCLTETFTEDELLNSEFIRRKGGGSIAGALIALEARLGYSLQERKSLSIYNCYVKAVKLYKELNSTENTLSILEDKFLSLYDEKDHEQIRGLLKKPILDVSEAIKFIKRSSTTSLSPKFVTSTQDLYSLQAGLFDGVICENLME